MPAYSWVKVAALEMLGYPDPCRLSVTARRPRYQFDHSANVCISTLPPSLKRDLEETDLWTVDSNRCLLSSSSVPSASIQAVSHSLREISPSSLTSIALINSLISFFSRPCNGTYAAAYTSMRWDGAACDGMPALPALLATLCARACHRRPCRSSQRVACPLGRRLSLRPESREG